MSSYVESYDYWEVFDCMWSVLVFSCVGCDRFVSCGIYGAVYRMEWIGYPNRHYGAEISPYVESYEYINVYDGNTWEIFIDSIICSGMNVI